jgi:hypothetical protein
MLNRTYGKKRNRPVGNNQSRAGAFLPSGTLVSFEVEVRAVNVKVLGHAQRSYG